MKYNTMCLAVMFTGTFGILAAADSDKVSSKELNIQVVWQGPEMTVRRNMVTGTHIVTDPSGKRMPMQESFWDITEQYRQASLKRDLLPKK